MNCLNYHSCNCRPLRIQSPLLLVVQSCSLIHRTSFSCGWKNYPEKYFCRSCRKRFAYLLAAKNKREIETSSFQIFYLLTSSNYHLLHRFLTRMYWVMLVFRACAQFCVYYFSFSFLCRRTYNVSAPYQTRCSPSSHGTGSDAHIPGSPPLSCPRWLFLEKSPNPHGPIRAVHCLLQTLVLTIY